MAAADYGFAPVGLDIRAESVARLQALGFTALPHDFMKLKFEVILDVLSMMDVLDQLPYPAGGLEQGGAGPYARRRARDPHALI